uniref:Putative secreted protein n=1 Tax=Ixodes ricinus TaxID=34613 RepID=A0A6B0U2B1_IXORI
MFRHSVKYCFIFIFLETVYFAYLHPGDTPVISLCTCVPRICLCECASVDLQHSFFYCSYVSGLLRDVIHQLAYVFLPFFTI